MRGAAIAGETLARERLMHHAEHRLAEPRQRDQRAPGRHAGNEGLGAVDRVEHPDIFGVGALGAELLADDAVLREMSGGSASRIASSAARSAAVTGSKRPPPALVLDGERGAEERQDGFAGDVGELDRRRPQNRLPSCPARLVADRHLIEDRRRATCRQRPSHGRSLRDAIRACHHNADAGSAIAASDIRSLGFMSTLSSHIAASLPDARRCVLGRDAWWRSTWSASSCAIRSA